MPWFLRKEFLQRSLRKGDNVIVNLIAIDPENDGRILQYRIPENSREQQILEALLIDAEIEYTILSRTKKETPR